ncbi:putative WRKY transcription factor 40 [Hordeum vulgare]|nr:putative WRKY transcription factor 40 [Hordeum vulgare]
MPSSTLGMEEYAMADWAIPNSIPPTHKPAIDECESPPLVWERMSTGTATAQVALHVFDGMSKQDREAYLATMINDNKDAFEMDYELEETTGL